MLGLGTFINNIAHHLKREFERAARPHGLTLLQWRVLSVLSHEEGITQKKLSSTLEVSPMTISDVLERLEAADLVVRKVDAKDSRAKAVWATAKGIELREKMYVIAVDIYERSVDGISADDKQAMVRALKQMSANLDVMEGQEREINE